MGGVYGRHEVCGAQHCLIGRLGAALKHYYSADSDMAHYRLTDQR